jgi:WS/DGAT/MGAT family acyltransferase
MADDARRMSDVEAMMWRLDKDPHLASTFANVTVCDRHLDVARLRARMERTATTYPRLRRRVQPAPGNFGNPQWVEDPNFDVGWHIRHVRLPEPGSMRQLLDLATLAVVDPFDRTRPLWQFIVVDGLAGGRGALIEKFHHTVTDGQGGVELSLQFLDLERDPAPPPPIPDEQIRRGDDGPGAGPDALRGAFADGMRIPLALLRQVRDVLADPVLLGSLGPETMASVRGLLAQATSLEPARSALWTQRTLRRRLDVLGAPFTEMRAAAKILGGTLNTAFVTAAADAAGAYHRRLGSPVDQLRTSIAVSTRTDAETANAFSLGRALVPTGEMDVDQRFALVDAALAEARSVAAGGSVDMISSLGAMVPTAVVTRLARAQAETVDFATSNVRGTGLTLYVAGARLLHNYPVGPVAGTAFNLTSLSYRGNMDMGLHIDAGAVPEPEILRSEMQAALERIVAVVPTAVPANPVGRGVRRRWKPRPPRRA